MLFNLNLLLGFLLNQDIKDVKGVFPQRKLEQSPLTQAPPSREEPPDLWIPKRKLWHRDGVVIVVDWCVWWFEGVGCLAFCSIMCYFGWTWREIETESPNRNSIINL